MTNNEQLAVMLTIITNLTPMTKEEVMTNYQENLDFLCVDKQKEALDNLSAQLKQFRPTI